MRLQRSAASYSRRFGLEIVRDKHAKINRYRFAPTEEQLSLIRGREREADPTATSSETELESQDQLF
jgi:hypothetical protein